MATLQSENSLIINRANNRSANMIVGNTNEEEVNTEIFIPDKNFNYIGNKPEDTDSNENSQFMVTTTNQPKNFSGLNEVENLILKYVKSDGTIQWVKDLESLGDFPNTISQTITRTLIFLLIF